MKQSRITNDLLQEAEAFDSQIEERIANVHIPDIRLAEPYEYFYNNSRRHPAYVKLDFGERFEWRYAFFHEFIGGLRFDEETNAKAAQFLREIDHILVETGVFKATEFLFVVRKVN